MDIKVNSTNKLAVLLILMKQPTHGYALMDGVERVTGVRPGPAQIYPLLSQLLHKKFVSASTKGARDKTVYALTPAGKRFASDLIVRMGVLFEGALDSNLTTCTHCSCKVFGASYTRKIGGKSFSFCCPHCADAFLSKDGAKIGDGPCKCNEKKGKGK